jgi:hypothetical protein
MAVGDDRVESVATRRPAAGSSSSTAAARSSPSRTRARRWSRSSSTRLRDRDPQAGLVWPAAPVQRPLLDDARGHVTRLARAHALRAAGNARRRERHLCTVMLKREPREILGLHEEPDLKLVPGLRVVDDAGVDLVACDGEPAAGRSSTAPGAPAVRRSCSTAPCGCSRSARSSAAGRRSYAGSIAALWRPGR